MFNPIKIAPSILSADFMHFEDDIRMIEGGGAGYIHYDVIDGHFGPNMTVGIPVLKQLTKIAKIPVDVHLMITNPLTQLPWFIDAGAHMITVHAEAVDEAGMVEAIRMIREAGRKACISLKPATPVSVLEPVIEDLDMVLVMSVEPGFSGQSYIEGSEHKVAEVAALAKAHGVAPLIEVDGGVSVKTVERLAAAGADVLVAGSAVFSAEDPAQAIHDITALGDAARLAALEGMGA